MRLSHGGQSQLSPPLSHQPSGEAEGVNRDYRAHLLDKPRR